MGVLGHPRTLVFVLAVAFGLALVFGLGRASSAASPNGVPPENFEVDMVVKNACDFAVHFEGSGKIKEIQKPDGGTLVPAPGSAITLTNVEEPANQVTVHNDAAWKYTPLPNGETLVEIPGSVISWPPLQLLVGRHTYLIDSKGNETLVSSAGQEIDLCASLA